ncbi:MAG: N-acetylmuramoyl-L-alanine amidase [Candidatus Omnitrophota bacterium]
MNWKRWIIGWSAVFSLTVGAMAAEKADRVLIGEIGGKTIRLTMVLLDGSEYVQASEIAPYLNKEWEYDSFSGTMIFNAPNGERFGIKIGDQRILAGSKILRHASAPPIRRNGRIYIPSHFAVTYLFPNVKFTEASAKTIPTAAAPSESPSALPLAAATPQDYIFRYPTRTPPPPTPTPFLYPAGGTPLPLQYQTPIIPWTAETPVSPPGDLWTKRIIVLDPGNDRTNPGAGGVGEVREEELTLILCEKIAKELLNERRYEVVFTRKRGQDLAIGNDERIKAANGGEGNVFVSVQCGSLYSDRVSRGAVFYMNRVLDAPLPMGKEPGETPLLCKSWRAAYQDQEIASNLLGKIVNQEMQKCYQNEGIVQLDSNPRPARLAALRGLTMPGIVVELGNLNHPMTAQYLSSGRIQEKIAYHIAKAIIDFLYQWPTAANGAQVP